MSEHTPDAGLIGLCARYILDVARAERGEAVEHDLSSQEQAIAGLRAGGREG